MDKQLPNNNYLWSSFKCGIVNHIFHKNRKRLAICGTKGKSNRTSAVRNYKCNRCLRVLEKYRKSREIDADHNS